MRVGRGSLLERERALGGVGDVGLRGLGGRVWCTVSKDFSHWGIYYLRTLRETE
jgi:hypothetical protein